MQDNKLYRKSIATLATILMMLASLVGGHTSFAWAQEATESSATTESAAEAPQSDAAAQSEGGEQRAEEPPVVESEPATSTKKDAEASEPHGAPNTSESEEASPEDELEISDEPERQVQRALAPDPAQNEKILGAKSYPGGPLEFGFDTELWYETEFDSPAQVTRVILSGKFGFTPEQVSNYKQWFRMEISRQNQPDVDWDFSQADRGLITINFPQGAVYDESNRTLDSPNQHYANLRVPKALFKEVDADITVYGALVAPDTPDNPSSQDFVRGDWRKKTVEKNPPLPQRCGLDVALVFDLSNSVGEKGLQGTKNAGKAFINSLNGTPTKVGIYNFGTDAPVNNIPNLPELDLTNTNDVRTALSNIDSFEYGSHYPDDEYDDWGGTNWEGALKDVRSSGVKYDVVYFITDGVPTTNSDKAPLNYGGQEFDDGGDSDAGRITHNQDISKAIDQANLLKKEKTRIEVLAVGNFSSGVPVLKDSARYRGGAAWDGHGDILPEWLDPASKAFWLVARANPDLRPKYDSQQGRFGYYSPSVTAKPYYFYLEDEITSVRTGERKSQTTYVSGGNKTYQWDVYKSNYTSGQEIMKSISGTDPGDVRFINDYSVLANQLKEAATLYCQGSLIVQKQIVNEQGEIIDERAQGWTFEDSDLAGHTGKLSLIRRNGSADNKQTTDETGQVGYRFKTEVPHVNGEITITEVAQDGYTLHQQDGKNAKCNVTDIAGGKEPRPINAEDNGNSGFRVGVGTGTAVYCVVQNKKSDVLVSFSVQKVDAENNGVPLDGAQFTVYPATVTDYANSKDGIALKPVEGDGSKLVLPPDAKLKPGSYQLVETKAPVGADGHQYSLLPQPIIFNVAPGEDGTSVVTVMGTGFATVDEDDPSVIKVANVYSGKLPKTGGIGVGVVALIGLVIVSAGVYFARRGNGQD